MTIKPGQLAVIASPSDCRAALCAQLIEMGQDVVPVDSEMAALEILRSWPIDMVFCDVEFKGETAGRLVFHILDEFPLVWLVATCRGGDEDLLGIAAAALEAGAKDFVTVPASLTELRRVLRAALG